MHCTVLLTLLADKRFNSPSAFSVHVKRLQTPNKQGDDGWKSVFVGGMALDEYRKRYRQMRMDPAMQAVQVPQLHGQHPQEQQQQQQGYAPPAARPPKQKARKKATPAKPVMVSMMPSKLCSDCILVRQLDGIQCCC